MQEMCKSSNGSSDQVLNEEVVQKKHIYICSECKSQNELSVLPQEHDQVTM